MNSESAGMALAAPTNAGKSHPLPLNTSADAPNAQRRQMENSMKQHIIYPALLALILAGPTWASEEHDHGHDEKPIHNESHADKHDEHGDEHAEDSHAGHGDDHDDKHGGHGGHDDHEEEGGIELTPAQMAAAGIVVTPLQPQTLHETVRAPGEVMFNAYRASKITPRITAQIVQRHAKLSDHVRRGQPLVTLSSVQMAEAQGDLLVSNREWQRVKKLGRKVVSDKRYAEAQVNRQQAEARVLAYGMSKPQVAALLKADDPARAIGRFDLYASQAGTVTSDDFILGEIIEPGRVLFDISDETSLWVEARLTPVEAHRIHTGTIATVRVDQTTLSGKVVQIHHAIDERTRTQSVRIAIKNPDDRLHPGMFVDVAIEAEERGQALALPLDAVVRSADGDWQVFIEEAPGRFEPKEVEVLRSIGNQVVIDGLAPGTRVVSQGTFFVQSELAKGGFEIHNH